MYIRFIKPFADFLVSLCLIFLLSPLWLSIILLLFLTQKQIFFIQKRVGYQNKPFYFIKFCTMNNRLDSKGKLLPDVERITFVGKFLRKSSLDELPQLLLVLSGKMSLVGPRPLLPEYLPLYDSFQIRRHKVKSGITGLAQVKGRNQISWQKRFEYDVYYVDNQSFILDLKILFLTVIQVLRAKGINANKTQTMERFKGN